MQAPLPKLPGRRDWVTHAQAPLLKQARQVSLSLLLSLALSCSLLSLSSPSLLLPSLALSGAPFISLSPRFPLPSLNKLHVGAQSRVCVS